MLEAEGDDHLADFDEVDFKRIEKETEDSRRN